VKLREKGESDMENGGQERESYGGFVLIFLGWGVTLSPTTKIFVLNNLAYQGKD